MSKADKLFKELDMKPNEVQRIVNGKIVEHTIEFKRQTVFEYGSTTTSVVFDILGKTIRYSNEHYTQSVGIIVAAYEKMKELGWVQ